MGSLPLAHNAKHSPSNLHLESYVVLHARPDIKAMAECLVSSSVQSAIAHGAVAPRGPTRARSASIATPWSILTPKLLYNDMVSNNDCMWLDKCTNYSR